MKLVTAISTFFQLIYGNDLKPRNGEAITRTKTVSVHSDNLVQLQTAPLRTVLIRG